MFVSRFPRSEVAAKIAVSLGIGLLVGIEREWSNKDLGARTFALTALLGTIAVLFDPSMAIVCLVRVFLIIIFANLRSLLVDRSLEATTSASLLVIFVLGALTGQGHLFTPVAAAILMTMLLAWKAELRRFAGGLQPRKFAAPFYWDFSVWLSIPFCRTASLIPGISSIRARNGFPLSPSLESDS